MATTTRRPTRLDLAEAELRLRHKHRQRQQAPLSPLDWAYAHATLRTADGRTLWYRDAPRGYQDALLADRHPRRLVLKGRQLGISQAVAFEACAEALAGGTVLWISRNGEQASHALRYCYTALDRAPRPAYTTRNTQSLGLANGGTIVTQPATAGAGRGWPATLVILDEMAWQAEADDIYTAVLPTLDETGGRLIALSTPNGRANLFFRLWQRAQSGDEWSRHFLPWSVHPERDAAWAERTRAELGPEAFAQEHDADFVASGAAVFAESDVAALWRLPALLPPEPGHRYVSAWDIARKRDATAGFTFDVSTAPFRVVAFERHLGMDYPRQAERIATRARAYPGRTLVESNGVGDPLIQFLAVPVEEFVTTALSKRNAIDALRLLLERRELVAPRLVEWERELLLYQFDDRNVIQDTVMASAIAALAAGRPVRAFSYATGGSRPVADIR